MDEMHGVETALGGLFLNSNSNSATLDQCESASRGPHSPWLSTARDRPAHASHVIALGAIADLPSVVRNNGCNSEANNNPAGSCPGDGCASRTPDEAAPAKYREDLSSPQPNVCTRRHADRKGTRQQQTTTIRASPTMQQETAAARQPHMTSRDGAGVGVGQSELPHRELAVNCGTTRHVFSYLCRVSRGLIGWAVHDGRAWPAHGRLLNVLNKDDDPRSSTAIPAGSWTRPPCSPDPHDSPKAAVPPPHASTNQPDDGKMPHADQEDIVGGTSPPEATCVAQNTYPTVLPPHYECACNKCGARGHMVEDCPLIVCMVCQHYGHRTSHCPLWDVDCQPTSPAQPHLPLQRGGLVAGQCADSHVSLARPAAIIVREPYGETATAHSASQKKRRQCLQTSQFAEQHEMHAERDQDQDKPPAHDNVCSRGLQSINPTSTTHAASLCKSGRIDVVPGVIHAKLTNTRATSNHKRLRLREPYPMPTTTLYTDSSSSSSSRRKHLVKTSQNRRQTHSDSASRRANHTHDNVAVAHIGGWWSAMIDMDEDSADAMGANEDSDPNPGTNKPCLNRHNNVHGSKQCKRPSKAPPNIGHPVNADSRGKQLVRQRQNQQQRNHSDQHFVAPLSAECVPC